MTSNFDSITLGESSETLTLSSRDSLNQVVGQFTRQAKHFLNIYGIRLELPIFRSTEIQTVLTPIIKRSVGNRVKVLVKDDLHFHRYNVHLREFARRFCSYIEVRKINAGPPGVSEFFLIADLNGYCDQPKLDQPYATVCAHAPSNVRRLVNLFTDVWERSEPMPEISSLGL